MPVQYLGSMPDSENFLQNDPSILKIQEPAFDNMLVQEKTSREVLLTENSNNNYSTDLHKASARLNDSILKSYFNNDALDFE